VPWSQRLQPGDLRPGDVLPTAPDDPRLVGGWSDVDIETLEEPLSELGFELGFELGLTRARVLSYQGRDEVAQHWYDGDSGPRAAVARAANRRPTIRFPEPYSPDFKPDKALSGCSETATPAARWAIRAKVAL